MVELERQHNRKKTKFPLETKLKKIVRKRLNCPFNESRGGSFNPLSVGHFGDKRWRNTTQQ